jgi:hypothetical protein
MTARNGVGTQVGNEKVETKLRSLTAAQLLELCGTAVRTAADYRLLHTQEYLPGKWIHMKPRNQEAMDALVEAIEREIAARLPEHDPGALVCLASEDAAQPVPA